MKLILDFFERALDWWNCFIAPQIVCLSPLPRLSFVCDCFYFFEEVGHPYYSLGYSKPNWIHVLTLTTTFPP